MFAVFLLFLLPLLCHCLLLLLGKDLLNLVQGLPLRLWQQEEDEDEPECVHGSVQPTKEVLGKVTTMNYIFFLS